MGREERGRRDRGRVGREREEGWRDRMEGGERGEREEG